MVQWPACLLLPLVVGLTTAVTFRTFMELDTYVHLHDHYQDVRNACECRTLCATDDTCTGVSVNHNWVGGYLCSFITYQYWLDQVTQEDLLFESPSFWTHLKMVCEGEFTLVPGVGCIQLFTNQITYEEAALACPFPSGLFAADSSVKLRKFQNYLVSLIPNIDYNYWVGISRVDADNKVWGWRTGATFSGAELGINIWAAGEPNGNDDCARLKYSSQGQIYFQPADTSCTKNFSFICQMF